MPPTPDIPTLLTRLASPHTPTAIRAARDLRLLSKSSPATLAPYRKLLIRHAMQTQDLRTRWNLTTVLGHLPLRGADRAAVIDWLFQSLEHPSGLVRTKSLQALFDLSTGDTAPGRALRARTVPFALRFSPTASPPCAPAPATSSSTENCHPERSRTRTLRQTQSKDPDGARPASRSTGSRENLSCRRRCSCPSPLSLCRPRREPASAPHTS